MSDEKVAAEMAAEAEIAARIEAYDSAVRGALRVLGVDPTCLTDPDLFGVLADSHYSGFEPTKTATAVVEAMRARDVAGRQGE